MRIKVDKKNKTIIAETFLKGKKIKAIAHCHDNDVFDENFGKELAIKKLNIKKEYHKMNWHDKEVRRLEKLIKWAENQIDYHNIEAEKLEEKVRNLITDYEKTLK